MANNFQVNVYQLNQSPYTRDAPVKFGFPTAGVLLKDVSASPTRSLPSGYNVYGLIIFNGDSYYTAETLSQLATLVG